MGFSIQNGVKRGGSKLPKSYVKSTNFLSNACINMGSLSMSFRCKIFNGSGVTYKPSNLKMQISKLKWTFFHSFNFEDSTPEPLKILQLKLMDKLPILVQAIEENLWI